MMAVARPLWQHNKVIPYTNNVIYFVERVITEYAIVVNNNLKLDFDSMKVKAANTRHKTLEYSQ